MATDKQKNTKATDAEKAKKTSDTTTPIERNKTITERRHGRTHESPKTKVDPRTL